MAVEGLQNYAQMVSGMTKATRAKAVGAAKALLAQSGLNNVTADASERVAKLADELMAASRANRDLLEKVVKAEVDKAASRLGFARVEDLDALRTEIAKLRQTLEDKARGDAAGVRFSPATEPPPTTSPSRKAAARKAATEKAATKKAATMKGAENPHPEGEEQ
jgi:polyhydroxyalkanoate synthesis regulator phasin